MKKSNSNASKKGTNNKTVSRYGLKWRTPAEILGDAQTSDDSNKVIFDLVARNGNGKELLPPVTLTIYLSDNDWDNALLNLFGVSIRCTVRSSKNGMFLSLPSQKGKDGNYYDIVTVYDKDFHAVGKEVLNGYYSDDAEGDE